MPIKMCLVFLMSAKQIGQVVHVFTTTCLDKYGKTSKGSFYKFVVCKAIWQGVFLVYKDF